MHKFKMLIALILLWSLSGFATGGFAGPSLNTARRLEISPCASGGSSASPLTAGQYLVRITKEDTYVCLAATCASGGEIFPAGTVVLLYFGQAQANVSCRSSGGTGILTMTEAVPR